MNNNNKIWTISEQIKFYKTIEAKLIVKKISSFYRFKRDSWRKSGISPLQGTYMYDAYPGIFIIEDYCMDCGFLKVFPYYFELCDIDELTIEKQIQLEFVKPIENKTISGQNEYLYAETQYKNQLKNTNTK